MVNHGPSRGCAECRKRRVKCDLDRPSCRNCLRRRLQCSGIQRGPTDFEFRREKLSSVLSTNRKPQEHQKPAKSSTIPCDSSNGAHLKTTNDSPEPVFSDLVSWDLQVVEQGPSSSARFSTSESRNNTHNYMSLLQSPKGSAYDPFGAFSVQVDSQVNELLNFWRSYLLRPSMEKNSAMLQLFRNAWSIALRYLWTQSNAYPFLASAADFYSASTKSNRLQILAMEWRSQALAGLRGQLGVDGLSPSNISCVLRLLGGDLAAGNFPAAGQHVKVLSAMFNVQKGLYENLPIGAKHAFLWQEAHRATATFTKPMIDLRGGDVLISSDLLQCNAASSDLFLDEKALEDPDLIQLFSQMRSCIDVLAYLYEQDVVMSSAASVELSMSLIMLSARLVKHSVTCSDRSLHTKNHLEKSRLCLSAAASLAALFWLRLTTRMETATDRIGGPRIMVSTWPQGLQIASRLQILLESAEPNNIATYLHLYSNARAQSSQDISPELRLRLWIQEVGCIIEQTNASKYTTPTNAIETYHQEQQHLLLRATGLSERSDVYESILNAFIPLNAASIRSPSWLIPSIRMWGLV